MALRKTGILALGTGAFAYLYHAGRDKNRVLAHTRDDSQELTTTFCPPNTRSEGKANVPALKAKDGPLVLQLQQVQVFFRHGARTPLYTIPYVSEVAYEPDLLTRDHQASMFPYERISVASGKPIDWSAYDNARAEKFLRGGASTGTLTGLGKEQMYMLGLRLRNCYRQRLDIATYDTDEVKVMSSNVRRTVQSAQSVLAGLYGKDQLIDYAASCGPVKILISDECYNILVPNTHTCKVLRTINESVMLNPDQLPDFREGRLEIEEHVLKHRDKLLEAVTDVQAKIEPILQFYESEGIRSRRLELNKHRQHYQHDPQLQPLYDERGRAIVRVDRFWENVLIRAPVISEIITKDDMKALLYLRDLRVEEFEGTLTSGYRVHFYFDKNPYFYNSHVCKEVYTRVNPAAPPSKQTSISWKPGRNLVPEEPEKEEEEPKKPEPVEEKPRIKYAKPPTCRLEPTVEPEPEKIVPLSLFHWLERPTVYPLDDVGPSLIGDVWKNPQSCLEEEPIIHDPWEHTFNFVLGHDDTAARIAHGLPYPSQVRRFHQMMERNAATMLHSAMTGPNPDTRNLITRLSAGPLLTEMIEQARRVVCGEKSHKLVLYSSHDSSLISVMEALCIWDGVWPPFASDLRLELYKEVDGCAGDFYLRILYNGKEQRIRGQTESYMHWVDFCNAIKRFVIQRNEHERICRSGIILEKIGQDKGAKEAEEEEAPAGM